MNKRCNCQKLMEHCRCGRLSVSFAVTNKNRATNSYDGNQSNQQGATISADYLVSAESLHAYANLHATIRARGSKLLDCEREKRVADTTKLQRLTHSRDTSCGTISLAYLHRANDSHDSSRDSVSYPAGRSFGNPIKPQSIQSHTATNSDNGL